MITRGAVQLDGRSGRIDDRVTAESAITVTLSSADEAFVPEDRPLAIAHEDDDTIVVDKPSGMHVHPIGPYRTGTLLNALLAYAGASATDPWGRWRPHPIHRLDRATSGLVLVAKSRAAHERLRRALEADQIQRTYRATVHGRIARDRGVIDAPLGRDPTNDYRRAVVPDGAHAVTHYRVLARTLDRTELELSLETGRTHQIRVHLASIGHPIVGDTLYGAPGPASPAIALRATELRWNDRTVTGIVEP